MSCELIIVGSMGRMGQSLVRLAQESQDFNLVGVTENQGNPAINQKHPLCDLEIKAGLKEIILQQDQKPCIIDFTSPKATLAHADFAAQHGLSLVIGTTGFHPDQEEKIHQYANHTSIVMAPNMSLGVNVLINLISKAIQYLGDDYDIEIFESHHRFKKDAPSGTALALAKAAVKSAGLKFPDDIVFSRQGQTGERDKKQVGMQVIRGGDIIGEHNVMLCGLGERLELGHIATNRDTFARGALKAALWLSQKSKGLYDMNDVLGIQ